MKNHHHKIFQSSVEKWWDSLSIEEQKIFKLKYENIRKENAKRKVPYPDMSDTTSTRISQLTLNQKFAIWRFKDEK